MSSTVDKKALLKQLLEKKAHKTAQKNFPLSYGQQALWFLHQNEPTSSAYHIALTVRIKSEIDLKAWKKTCQRLINRHPILRTTYGLENKQLQQKIHGFMPVDFSYEDASHLKGKAFDDFVKICYEKPFDLANGPVSRVFLIKQGEKDHILLFNIHHIACDGYSTWIILEELKQLYSAEVEGKKANLKSLETSYIDFVKSQKNILQNDKGEKLWQYWKNQLKGDFEPINLPEDKPRPATQTYNGSSISIKLKPELTDRLRELSKNEGVTPFVTLASAFQVLLYRYSGQDDILIGTPTNGRDRNEFRSLVGYFVNPVVLKANFAENLSFSAFLQRNKNTIVGAIANQDFPFPYLVEKLQLKRDQSRSPVFQAFFSFLKSQGDEVVQALMTNPNSKKSYKWGKLELEAYEIGQQEGQFDLTLALTESQGEIFGKFKFNTDIFEKSTIERMAQHFENLLLSISSQVDIKISDLNFMSDQERQLLIHDVNQTETPYPEDKCMHELFEARADKDPDLMAVSMPALSKEGKKSSFTYLELEEKANQVAHFLQKRGIGPEQKVGLCVHRSPDMIVGMLGILKAGGAYIPLDPEYPEERLNYIIEDSGLSIILTQEGASGSLPDKGKPQFFLDKDWAEIAKERKTRPTSEVKPDNLAYIIYTSGSTGKPKGVLIEHNGVVNKMLNFKQGVTFTRAHRFTLLASYSFDASLGQFFMPLVNGSPLFLLPKDQQKDPTAFWDFILDNKVNILYTVSSFLGAMLDTARDLTSVQFKYIFLGAEVFPLKVLNKIREKLKVDTIVNMYGPTETTVNCVMYDVEGTPKGSIPLGTALPNYTAYVLDKYLNLVPPGVTGEIHVGGMPIARGYHNLPKLTAERFIPDFFSQKEGARLYKSGDLGKYLPDGKIAFMGRVDKQVKVNGFRIEPGEVEVVINQHPEVKDVLVIAKEDKGGNKRLVAYMIPANGQSPSSQEMRTYLKAKLPSYMVPSAYVEMEAFPIFSSSGKIDVSSLPDPEVRNDSGVDYVAPSTQAEKLLAKIWSEILSIEKIGVNDNFFELGGASVQSIQVVNRANEIGFQLSATMIFEFQTLKELAKEAAINFSPDRKEQPSKETKIEQEIAPSQSINFKPAMGTDVANSLIESVGTYLPPKVVPTQELIDDCQVEIRFPLEKMTGIKTRRMAGEEEFAIDMAKKAAEDCFSRSTYNPEDIELLICCNISRYDAPSQVSFEPSTAAKISKHFGMKNAMIFDLSNACATMWTGINIVDSFISNGVIKCGMVVSGEYITHIAKTATKEITESFIDPRMACLTVGDSGAAVILERSPSKDLGFHFLHMYTESELCRNCVAYVSDKEHGGAIMFVESVKAAASAIQPGAKLALNVIQKGKWLPEPAFQHILVHQTSATTIGDARREINSLYNQKIATKENTINNIAHRGNTATTSHWLAVMDRVKQNEVKSGEKIVFGISGSGHTLGTALYTLDDLPDRILNSEKVKKRPSSGALIEKRLWPSPANRVSIESIGVLDRNYQGDRDTVEYLKSAVKDCLTNSNYHKEELGLVIHTGMYRKDFLQEPAIAALVAGELRINDHPEVESSNKTFTFDLLNGALGFLNACYASIQMIQAGKYHTSLILAAEMENNAKFRPDALMGLRETGSAMILHQNPTDNSGFGNFVFKTFPAYLDTTNIYCTWYNGESFLNFTQNPNLESYYTSCILTSVEELLELEGLKLSDVKVVLPPQISPGFISSLADSMSVDREKFVDVSSEGEDLYTSSIPYMMQYAKNNDLVKSGDIGLIISAGSGIQVGCALYYF